MRVIPTQPQCLSACDTCFLSTFWQPLFPGWYGMVCSYWSPASAFCVDGAFITFQSLFSATEPSDESLLLCSHRKLLSYFSSIKSRTEKTRQMELLPIVHSPHSLHTCVKRGGEEGPCWGCQTELSKRGRELSVLRSIPPDDRIPREAKVPGQRPGVWAQQGSGALSLVPWVVPFSGDDPKWCCSQHDSSGPSISK